MESEDINASNVKEKDFNLWIDWEIWKAKRKINYFINHACKHLEWKAEYEIDYIISRCYPKFRKQQQLIYSMNRKTNTAIIKYLYFKEYGETI